MCTLICTKHVVSKLNFSKNELLDDVIYLSRLLCIKLLRKCVWSLISIGQVIQVLIR